MTDKKKERRLCLTLTLHTHVGTLHGRGLRSGRLIEEKREEEKKFKDGGILFLYMQTAQWLNFGLIQILLYLEYLQSCLEIYLTAIKTWSAIHLRIV